MLLRHRSVAPSEIMVFFETDDGRVVELGEFMAFWKSVSDEDKLYYRQQVYDWIFGLGDFL
jgi:hypothetical protein